MGIPAYMSYILKNYTKIIKTYKQHQHIQTSFDCLYMDCNSIIYDVYNNIVKDKFFGENIEEKIILEVIKKIEYYIFTINPTDILFIAFDGVAPFSKMEQQRVRRYKTWHMGTINLMGNNEEYKRSGSVEADTRKSQTCRGNSGVKDDRVWSTSSITPGTLFMNNLSKKVKRYFVGEVESKTEPIRETLESMTKEFEGDVESKTEPIRETLESKTKEFEGEKESKKFEGKKNENKYGIQNIIVTGSDEVGEGEQKIFKYIRSRPHNDKNIFIYGLDSDLIMLSIFHYKQCKNIFVFREEPEFVKSKIVNSTVTPPRLQTLSSHTSTTEFSVSVPSATPPRLQTKDNSNELLFLDISQLSETILSEMCETSVSPLSTPQQVCEFNGLTQPLYSINRIYDYLFLCFFLGNDFLPHFPSLNIRTNGIKILLETYKQNIGKYPDRYFISKNGKIQWKWLKKFVEILSKNEKQMFLREYELRNKMDHYKWQQTTYEEKEYVLHNTPIIYRADEKYICPNENMWEDRYYKNLFDKERTPINIEKISINFLEGLEWVFKYYTNDCPDWKWKYKYHYPPLFIDLLKYIPDVEKDFVGEEESKTYPIRENLETTKELKYFVGEDESTKETQEYLRKNNIPFTPALQLSYVLPEANHYLLGDKRKEFLKKNYSCLFPEKITYKWAFCRYFFESHILLPEISIETLEKLEKELLLI